ncbi:hypothetical protein FPQ18DRAFT_377746 [Pyronema domesticum]|uniref:Uncharacterized protein n=1 Tax=Pyronema omphalodes (strain CBS 100304) TaxID=1076935 RepID=U4LHC0_PYROM|nr:hypothetical protein FPQ18DRAFT_377746 [Pyronema domesticum]CCX11457.1 Protein of unknown function [Pyronema omphalodes CBS 100304]
MAETVLPTSIPGDDPEDDPRDNLKDASTVDAKEKPEDDSTPEQSSGEDFEEPALEPNAVQETLEALELPTGDEKPEEDNPIQAEPVALVDNLLEGLEGLTDSGSYTQEILDTDLESKAVQEILEGLELPTGDEQAEENNPTLAESEALVDNLLEGPEGLADSGSHTEQILDTDLESKAVQKILEGLELPTGEEQAKEDNPTQAESKALVDNL